MVSPQRDLLHGVIPLQVQDFAFSFVELHQVSVSPFLNLVKDSLNGSTAMWYIIHSIQFCILCKLAEAALCHIIQIINEDIEQQQW